MTNWYYVPLERHDDPIEIEATIKNRLRVKVPSWHMDVSTQDLIAIKNKIEEILRDEQIS